MRLIFEYMSLGPAMRRLIMLFNRVFSFIYNNYINLFHCYDYENKTQ